MKNRNIISVFLLLSILLQACQAPNEMLNSVFNDGKQDLNNFIQSHHFHLEENKNGIAVSIKDLPCDCHVQGIGWAAESKQIVITCQDRCEQESGAYLFLYEEEQLLPLDVQKSTVGVLSNHPSAIQIQNGVFPVAFASTRNQDSFIEFYTIANKRLSPNPAASIHVPKRHIGALAYANIKGNTYLIGVGWDAEDLTIWQATGENKTTDFQELSYRTEVLSIIPDKDKPAWGAYNSLWLGSLIDGRVVLLGTHGKTWERGSSLDVWEIHGLASQEPRLELLNSNTMTKKTKKGIHYFYEGVTLKTKGSSLDTVSLLAAPHDFTTLNCPTGYRCSDAIYEFRAY